VCGLGKGGEVCVRWESVWDEWGGVEGAARLEIGGEGKMGLGRGNKEYGLV
jgi:hypothetical protein